MKRLFACVVIGAVALFWGCSDTASGPVNPPDDGDISEVDSSDSSAPGSSASEPGRMLSPPPREAPSQPISNV